MTQNHEQKIIRALEKAGQFELPQGSYERDLERVRERLAGGHSRRSLWRTVVRSRWAKPFSVAAVLAIATMAFLFFLEPQPAAAELLAQVARAMDKLAWAKIVTESFAPGREEPVSTDVQWTDATNRRVYAIYDRKYIHLMDYARRQWSVYRPETNDMVVEPLAGEWVSPSGAIQTYVRKLRDEGIEVTQSEQMHENRAAVVLEFTESLNYVQGNGPVTNMMMNGRHVKTLRHKLIIDKQDHLLGAAEITYLDPNDAVIVTQRSTSEPVETGPADIYELGVPRSATIINHMPDGRVQQVREQIAAHASRFLDTYIAVITEARVENGQEQIIEGMVVFRRGKALRVDVYRRLYSQPDNVTPRCRRDLDASLSRLKAYWPEGENWGIRSVRLYDGLWQHVLDVKDDKLTAWEKQRRPDGDAYADDDLDDFAWRTLWWLNEPEHMFEDDYSRAHGLIAVELASPWQGYRLPERQVAYYDPQKDYVCHRYVDEELFDAPWQNDKNWMEKVRDKRSLTERSAVREVTEYGRTSTGHWYPTTITETGHERPWDGSRVDVTRIIRIHLITEHPEFPEGIFDAAALPRADD